MLYMKTGKPLQQRLPGQIRKFMVTMSSTWICNAEHLFAFQYSIDQFSYMNSSRVCISGSLFMYVTENKVAVFEWAFTVRKYPCLDRLLHAHAKCCLGYFKLLQDLYAIVYNVPGNNSLQDIFECTSRGNFLWESQQWGRILEMIIGSLNNI